MHQEKQHIRKELEKISPLLARQGKDLPYKVPEGYFTSLDPLRAVKSRTPASGPASIIPLRAIIRYAAAAAVAFFLFTTWWYAGDSHTASGGALAGTITFQDPEIWTEEEISGVLELAAVPAESWLTELTEEEALENLFAGIPDQELERYLLDRTVLTAHWQ